jgi:hypothetical protein
MSTSADADAGQCNEYGGSAQGADMEHTQTRPIVFAHSANSDATIDSICRNCSLVVARAFKEGDLEHLELRHVCQPVERRKSIRTAHRVFPYLD